MMLFRKGHVVAVVLLGSLLLSGCVTEEVTENGRPIPIRDKEADRRSALVDYITLANGYMHDGNRPGALRAINKGLAIDKNSAELHNVLAYYYMTDSEDELAEKEYKKAIDSDSSYTASYLNYGVFLFQRQRYDEACEKFYKATQDVMYTRRDAAFLNYGVCLKKQGKIKEAEEALRRSYVNNANNPIVVLEMADLKFQTGEFEQSNQLYEKFQQMTQQNAQSLWLGVRLARALGKADKEASYALLLKNQFPASPQYSEYKAWSNTR